MPSPKPTNIASLPQRSPLRYPGGKTWLVPQLRAWLASVEARPRVFVEPFASGASMSLTVAAEELAERVVMAELDPNVAVVWTVIIEGDAQALAKRIKSFDLTETSVREELDRSPETSVDHAFQTILRNRVQRGGIMAPGAGRMRAGENGKGLASRWYPETLARRITEIQRYRHRIEFIAGDGLEVIAAHTADRDAVFFIDPPYTAGGKRAGSRLYSHSAIDHSRLFTLASGAAGDILLTYDNSPEVQDMARAAGLATKPIAMRSTHNAVLSELLVGRDLSWAS